MSTSTQNTAAVNAGTVQHSNNGNNYDMVVFCHLRWDFVYQRPQHIISRIAKNRKVLFIEEPWFREEQSDSRLIKINDNLHVLQPNAHTIDDIAAILPQYVSKNIETGWFYSASFVPLLNYFSFGTIIYDCMDELSLFKGAPEKLIEQEKYLMGHAEIVFTGGKSLYESKIKHHGNVYCFPSSVDREHFKKALNGISIPEDMPEGKLTVGYFGVIDERIDMQLINSVALLKPEVNFVMIGPLAKIGEHELAKQHNIHYLGMKDYRELPAYLKGFAIAMMPFALNDATKYISPTKTLEYMAAGKAIISTAITDVVRDYSNCVSIVNSAEEFAAAIESIMAAETFKRITAYSDILEKTSWDTTVQNMEAIMKTIVA
jgi:glycosyltransferase involved in cell wall biosynthesis